MVTVHVLSLCVSLLLLFMNFSLFSYISEHSNGIDVEHPLISFHLKSNRGFDNRIINNEYSHQTFIKVRLPHQSNLSSPLLCSYIALCTRRKSINSPESTRQLERRIYPNGHHSSSEEPSHVLHFLWLCPYDAMDSPTPMLFRPSGDCDAKNSIWATYADASDTPRSTY